MSFITVYVHILTLSYGYLSVENSMTPSWSVGIVNCPKSWYHTLQLQSCSVLVANLWINQYSFEQCIDRWIYIIWTFWAMFPWHTTSDMWWGLHRTDCKSVHLQPRWLSHGPSAKTKTYHSQDGLDWISNRGPERELQLWVRYKALSRLPLTVVNPQ